MKTLFPILWTIGALCGIGALIGWYDVSKQADEVQQTANRVVELLEEQQSANMVEASTSGNFERLERGMDISIPAAAEAVSPPNGSVGEIIISIDADGQIVVNATQLSDEELARRIREISEWYRDQPVVLRAEESAPYARIVEVLDVVKAAGLWNVDFAAQKENPK